MAEVRGGGFSLPVSKKEYLTLVDWTGRQFRPGKPGRISSTRPPIIRRLERSSRRSWFDEMSHLTRIYWRAIGSIVSLSNYRDHLGQIRLRGLAG